jgi:hypothetical protein
VQIDDDENKNVEALFFGHTLPPLHRFINFFHFLGYLFPNSVLLIFWAYAVCSGLPVIPFIVLRSPLPPPSSFFHNPFGNRRCILFISYYVLYVFYWGVFVSPRTNHSLSNMDCVQFLDGRVAFLFFLVTKNIVTNATLNVFLVYVNGLSFHDTR